MRDRPALSLSVLCPALLLAGCARPAPQAEAPALQRHVQLEDPARLGVGRRVELPPFAPHDREPVPSATYVRDHAATVVCMTSTGCPLSNKFGPRLASLEREYASRNVAFVYVNTVPAESLQDMREKIAAFELSGLYLPDRDGAVTRALGGRTTTEVFVLSRDSTLVYRGAIDDQYGVGASLDAPRTNFLKDALDACLAGRRPRISATWAPGCLIDPAADEPAPSPGPPLTYYSRIAHILDANCIQCHRDAGAAPFPLGPSSFEGRASMIEAVVSDRLMPPSHGITLAPGESSPWESPTILPQTDRDDLLAWMRSTRELGDAAAGPAPRRWPLTWAIASPDMVLVTPSVRVPAQGPAEYSRFVIPVKNRAETWAAAIELSPVNPENFRSALAWLVPPGGKMPAAGELPGGDGVTTLLGTWSPGFGRVEYRPGVARSIPAGSHVVVDMLTRSMGRQMSTSLRIGLRTLDAPGEPAPAPAGAVRVLTMRADPLEIAPRDPAAHNAASLVLDRDSRLIALTPVMGRRGRQVQVIAQLPGGESRTLLDAPHFDSRWLIRFELKNPIELPAGTRLTLRGVHDNSESNRDNPDPAARPRCGPGPADERLILSIECEDSRSGRGG